VFTRALQLYTILSQTNQVSTHTQYSFEIHFNIMFSCTSVFPRCPLPFSFLRTKTVHACIISAIRATYNAHLILLHLKAVITFVKSSNYQARYCVISSSFTWHLGFCNSAALFSIGLLSFSFRDKWFHSRYKLPYTYQLPPTCSPLNVVYAVQMRLKPRVA
jgi:hypothetical protein